MSFYSLSCGNLSYLVRTHVHPFSETQSACSLSSQNPNNYLDALEQWFYPERIKMGNTTLIAFYKELECGESYFILFTSLKKTK